MDKTTPNTTQKPLTDRWIDVFKAGTHTDSTGRVTSFTHADLDQIVANHALGAAPAVLGHPKDNDPAFAKVESMKREGDLLFVKFKDINPAFEAGVASGAYYNRSVSIYRDKTHGLRLRHVGWLGAMPPAIDGLSPINSYSADDGEVMEFASPGFAQSRIAWSLQAAASLLRGLREMLIADKGVEDADRLIPNYRLEQIETNSAELLAEAATTNNFSKEDEPMPFTQEQLDAAKAEAAKETEMKFSKQIEEANQRAAAVEAERRAERIGAQIEGWKKDGKVLPAEAPGLTEFMTSLETAPQSFEFSATDGKSQVKKTPAEWFAEFMAAQPKKVALGEKSEAGDTPTGEKSARELAAQAQEYINGQAAKGMTVSYAEAMAHVSK